MFIFVFWLLIILLLFACIDAIIFPMIRSASEQKASSKASTIINESVNSIIDAENIKYEDIVFLEKNETGSIVALTTNVKEMNRLKTRVSLEILRRLGMYSEDSIKIPFGNIFGSSFLLGKGPDIKVYMHPYGAIKCDYRNVFESCGINQTNHRVMLDIELTVCVVMPLRSVNKDIKTSICVADTVIVGEVPQAFTNVQNYSSSDEGATVADEVVDFGAHNYLE